MTSQPNIRVQDNAYEDTADVSVPLTGTFGNHEHMPTSLNDISLGDVETKFDVDADSDPARAARGTWASEFDFILACVGFAVGLGNIWRFPYLCYKNGGGAFLVPYLLVLFTCGIPIFLIELGLGQYMRRGFVDVWRICPAFQGLGGCIFLCLAYLNIYYIVILAWDIYYFIMSFQSVLPWAHCDNEWNTPRCAVRKPSMDDIFTSNVTNSSVTTATTSVNVTYGSLSLPYTDPVTEFWERKVLHISSGIDEPGYVVGELAGCLFLAWVLVYLCVWRGVRWSGKIVYFTALFPYVILTCLVIRGVTLEGAVDGLKFYFYPDFSRLGDPQVWVDGCTQIMFSYALGFGVLLTLGSYNQFHNNFYRKCLIVSGINTFTSLFGGIAVFSVLGFMAREHNTTVADVAESGPGLVFIAYPKAITQMPLSQFWSALFFFMILLVGIDSQFVAVEAIVTVVLDRWPTLYRMKGRMVTTAVYCLLSFLIGLSMVTQGGMYVFQLLDYYSVSGVVLFWICFWQTIVISWVIGAEKFSELGEMMLGHPIPRVFVYCWKFVTPLVTMSIFLFILVTFTPLTYNKTYVYSQGWQMFGLCLALSSVICLPIGFIYKMAKAQGSIKQRWKYLTTPILEVDRVPKHWQTEEYRLS
uniref:Transporter n=1 Tax=Sinonovacula rivularis TaxID=489091 RepID=A0AA49X8G1_9BIVA|nr:NTT2 [Sinonovacula rivularis]